MEKHLEKIATCSASGYLKIEREAAWAYYESKLAEVMEARKEHGNYSQDKDLDLADFCLKNGLDCEAKELYEHVFESCSWEAAGIGLRGRWFLRAVDGLSALCCSPNECVFESCSQMMGDYYDWKNLKDESAKQNHDSLQIPAEGFYETAANCSERSLVYSISARLCNRTDLWADCINLEENVVMLPSEPYEGLGLCFIPETCEGHSLKEGHEFSFQLFAHNQSAPLFTATACIDDDGSANLFLPDVRLTPGVYHLFLPGASPLGFISQFCQESKSGMFYEFRVIEN